MMLISMILYHEACISARFSDFFLSDERMHASMMCVPMLHVRKLHLRVMHVSMMQISMTFDPGACMYDSYIDDP